MKTEENKETTIKTKETTIKTKETLQFEEEKT